MKILIKADVSWTYPDQLKGKALDVVSYAIHPTTGSWQILVIGPDGEFYSVERKHAKYVTKLEDVLK
jgi:hypothetical protein